MAIWQTCNGDKEITTLNETAWRIVESQYITATRKLVDSLDEQILLEEMIDAIKPELVDNYDQYHPLLYTPFRYPPLKHGSRFGKRTEPSLWYGSLERNAAMAEKAYYQFNFIRAVQADLGLVQTQLTLFTSTISTQSGVYLNHKPFATYRGEISSPISYHVSQQLGEAMRAAHVEAFTYFSARCDKTNIALFTPLAFKKKRPDLQFQSWTCNVNDEHVEFVQTDPTSHEVIVFDIKEFQVEGHLPFPAA